MSDHPWIPADLTTIYAHISDASIHFTQAQIDHLNLQNIGTKTHGQIDSHINDASIHFTQAQIDHFNILNRGTNTHATIDIHIANLNIHASHLLVPYHYLHSKTIVNNAVRGGYVCDQLRAASTDFQAYTFHLNVKGKIQVQFDCAWNVGVLVSANMRVYASKFPEGVTMSTWNVLNGVGITINSAGTHFHFHTKVDWGGGVFDLKVDKDDNFTIGLDRNLSGGQALNLVGVDIIWTEIS